jgi:hypothetical protein
VDDETNHAPEVVGYVAFGSFEKGPIMGRSNLNLGCEGKRCIIPHHETFSITIQPRYSSTKG